LICAEGWDVHVFDSADELVAWVEAVDVKEGIYRCFDSDGTLLDLLVDELDRISVQERSPGGTDVVGLTKLLRESLATGRTPVETAGLDLTSLIDVVRRRH
jgi:hypothetical protein